MIPRQLHQVLLQRAKKFPVVVITGPRQSGKTTLARAAFPRKPYVSLEDPDTRALAMRDPRGFLSPYPQGVILDEIQRAPELLSYLQTLVDSQRQSGLFILTGSHHLLLLQTVAQTLAGRASLLSLLPFSLEELRGTPWGPTDLDTTLRRGLYPRIYDRSLDPVEWYPDYLQTYLERDVRLIKQVGDLMTFHRFLKLCAGRTGCLLNLSSLAQDAGITHNTAKAWLSVLEASFVVFLLPPHHRNFNKRLVKTPKLYFYDTGLACTLLEIETLAHLQTHPARGHLVETLVVSELLKRRLHRGLPANLSFWRDKTGHEIDCLVQHGAESMAVDIQAGRTITEDSFKNLHFWTRLAQSTTKPSFLIYGGDQDHARGTTTVLGWRALGALPKAL